jgi:hypothetical protein
VPSKCSTTWAMPPQAVLLSLFFFSTLVCFQRGSHTFIRPAWDWNPPPFASRVTGYRHAPPLHIYLFYRFLQIGPFAFSQVWVGHTI